MFYQCFLFRDEFPVDEEVEIGDRRRGGGWGAWVEEGVACSVVAMVEGRTGGRCLPSHTPTRSSRVPTPQPPPPRCRHTLTPSYGAHPCDVTRAALTPARTLSPAPTTAAEETPEAHVNLSLRRRKSSHTLPYTCYLLTSFVIHICPSFHLHLHVSLLLPEPPVSLVPMF